MFVCFARFDHGDARVAFAILELAAEEPTSWELALIPGEDPSQLSEGYFYGYGVDGGLGCFTDLEGAKLIQARNSEGLARDPHFNYWDNVLESEMYGGNEPNDWVDHRPFPDKPNVAIFSAGFGDGMYPSYFGLDAQGEPVCLVTDFIVVN